MAAVYNAQMHTILPKYGITVTEIPRIEESGQAISASLVRERMAQRDIAPLRPLVPETTYRYLERMKVDEVCKA